jgi:hypothetical protein
LASLRAPSAREGALAWSAGITYILYDVILMVIVVWLTWPKLASLWMTSKTMSEVSSGHESKVSPSLGIVIAAYNEALVLPETLAALCA